MKKILFLIFLIIPNIAMSYETAKYEITKIISDKVEIREYKDLVLATISTGKESQNNNFRTLFKFISGENEQNEEIKMTTPVTQTEKNGNMTMQFYIPAEFDESNVPDPNNSEVKVEARIESSSVVSIK